MREELKQDIIDFNLGKLSKVVLLAKLPTDSGIRSKELRKIIEEAIATKNSEDVELGITLLWLVEEKNEFTDLVHKLILETWHTRYEDLIHDLQDRKEDSSVPIIKKAIQQKYDFLESYETGMGQFISQCGYALFSIGTHEAISAITDLSNSNNEMIKREMHYQLKSLANHPDAENTEKTPRWWT
jgi:hypothetical protein